MKKKRHGEINLDQIEKREEEALIIKDQVREHYSKKILPEECFFYFLS